MGYKILCDSCTDFTPAMEADPRFVRIPLVIDVDGQTFVDDGTIRQEELLSAMRASQGPTRTACPAPEAYLSHFETADDIYIITLSERLSGSYNAADQAVKCYREEGGRHNVHVFNSRSASAGQVQAALKIQELAEQGLPFDDVVDQVEQYLDEMDTMFVLESLENLRKNGRLTKVQALVTGSLRIKLLMGATPEGEIIKLGQGFTERQALQKMIRRAAENAGHAGKRLVISHCNCLERASYVRELAEKLCRFREILITATGGISTVYAYDGGIVIAY